jgi:hypothetical protein
LFPFRVPKVARPTSRRHHKEIVCSSPCAWRTIRFSRSKPVTSLTSTVRLGRALKSARTACAMSTAERPAAATW